VFGRISSLILDFVSLFVGFISLFGCVGNGTRVFLYINYLRAPTGSPHGPESGFSRYIPGDQGTLSRPIQASPSRSVDEVECLARAELVEADLAQQCLSRGFGSSGRPYRAPIGAPGSARSALCTMSNDVTTPRSSAVLAIGSQAKTSPAGSSPWHMKVDTPARLSNPG
jgi:hypothetical protein